MKLFNVTEYDAAGEGGEREQIEKDTNTKDEETGRVRGGKGDR